MNFVGSCKRLENCALRPFAYFNLKAIHGQTDLLHYDLYNMDTGEALEPEIDVLNAQRFSFSHLEDVAESSN